MADISIRQPEGQWSPEQNHMKEALALLDYRGHDQLCSDIGLQVITLHTQVVSLPGTGQRLSLPIPLTGC